MRLSAALFCCTALLGCASQPRPDYMQPRESGGRLEVVDTLPGFLSAVRAELDTGKVEDVWGVYQQRHAALFAAAGAASEDPGNENLIRLIASTEAILDLVEIFEAAASEDVAALDKAITALLGPPPRLQLVFAVAVEPQALFRGTTADGRPLRLINARHPDLAAAPQRRAVLARELFALTHQQLQPDSSSLGPLARRVYREGAASFATRQLVPDAPEHQVLSVPEYQLTAARKRERLIAKELLASLDSASEIEEARFFDPLLKDPLLPRAAGAWMADKVYQRLAIELGSTTRPLQLEATEFLPRARKHLQDIAAGR